MVLRILGAYLVSFFVAASIRILGPRDGEPKVPYLYIYWVHNTGIMYPTLQMAKTCLKRRLFDDKNVVFWMGFGFRNSRGGGPLGLNRTLASGPSGRHLSRIEVEFPAPQRCGERPRAKRAGPLVPPWGPRGPPRFARNNNNCAANKLRCEQAALRKSCA